MICHSLLFVSRRTLGPPRPLRIRTQVSSGNRAKAVRNANTTFLPGVAAGLALILTVVASNSRSLAPEDPAALKGQVRSTAEGLMEGVVVSAKNTGSTVTVSVLSDTRGGSSFPRNRLAPGQYSLSIRAVGYEMDDPGPSRFP